MRTVNIHAAEMEFSRLVDEASAGEEIIIAKAGQPVARLMPLQAVLPKRQLNGLAGRFELPDNFDDPLPDDFLTFFDGSE